jgi:S-adenosyl-L-methionine hydrolase (adenosine-forming)
MIAIFSDFGSHDIYLGQIKAALNSYAPNVPVVDLINDLPVFNVCAAAHLLAALAHQCAANTVFLSVVDPQVGSERRAVAVKSDDRWFVGPDNGLLSIVANRSSDSEVWQILWQPQTLSRSFHGRDLFAPVAAQIATANISYDKLKRVSNLEINFDSGSLNEIIYIDHYGNAISGLTCGTITHDMKIIVAKRVIDYAAVFSQVGRGDLFWYENSIGLIEIAANQANAAKLLDLVVGQSIAIA